MNYYNRKVQVFFPNAGWRRAWDFFNLFNLIVYTIYIPLKLSFNLRIMSNYYSVYFFFDIIPFFNFFFDIFITLNTAYFSRGSIIIEKAKIFNNYVQNELLLDFITLLPLILTLFIEKLFFFELLFFLRIFKLKKQFKKMEEYLQLSEKNQGFNY